MSSNSDVKTVESPANSTDAALDHYLPVGSNPETIKSVSKALQNLQSVAKRAQFPVLVPAAVGALSVTAEDDQDVSQNSATTPAEYAMLQRGRNTHVGAERYASSQYNGAKSIW